jgi:hypothetical protein
MTDLVEQLSRLGAVARRDVVSEARTVRRRRVWATLREIRTTLLPGFSDRKAAHTIATVASGCRDGTDPALCGKIEQQLREALGSLDDVPGADRIRQLITG